MQQGSQIPPQLVPAVCLPGRFPPCSIVRGRGANGAAMAWFVAELKSSCARGGEGTAALQGSAGQRARRGAHGSRVSRGPYEVVQRNIAGRLDVALVPRNSVPLQQILTAVSSWTGHWALGTGLSSPPLSPRHPVPRWWHERPHGDGSY